MSALCSIVSNQPVLGGTRQFVKLNPADPRDVIGPFTAITAEGYEKAIRSAMDAGSAWRAQTVGARGRILERAAAIICERADRIAATLTREEGKTLGEAKAEIVGAARFFQLMGVAHPWGATGRVGETDGAGRFAFTRRDPLGVVGAITPWNFPFSNPAVKLSAALIAGNTVVWKPSPWTPLTSLALTDCLIEAGLPSGVLSTLLDDTVGSGEALTGDPRVAAVSFTGSTRVGKLVAKAAGARSAPVQLELGGKNAIVVLADADLALAARQTARSAFLSAGQKCTAASRVIVISEVRQSFLELLIAETKKLTVGDPTDRRTDVGPVVHESFLNSHLDIIHAASSAGLSVVEGGYRLGDTLQQGYFLAPTIVDQVPRTHQLAQDELFGPVLSVLHADDLAEAIEIVNESRYGFVASVFTRDLSQAFAFVEQTEAGVVKINEPTTGSSANFPIGGSKASGLGEPELGPDSTRFFSREKTIYVNSAIS